MKLLCIVFVTLSLYGCTVSPDKYQTHSELIASEFEEPTYVLLTSKSGELFATGDLVLNKRYNSLAEFCKKDGGSFNKIENSSISKSYKNLYEKTGLFECVSNVNETVWMAAIHANRGQRYSSGNTSYYLIVEEYDVDRYKKGKQAEKAAQAKLEREAFEYAQLTMDNFKQQSRLTKNVGERVCSFDNRIAWVDQVAGNKLKLIVIEKAKENLNGLFFTGKTVRVPTYSLDNQTIWDNSSNWAYC